MPTSLITSSIMFYPMVILFNGFVVVPYICRVIVLLSIQIGFSQTYFWIKSTLLFGLVFLATLIMFMIRTHSKVAKAIECMKTQCASTCAPCVQNLIPMSI